MKAIFNLDVPIDSTAPKPSSHIEEVPRGKKPGAKSGHRRKQSSKHTSESKNEASKTKTEQLEKEPHFFHLHSEFASRHDASVDSTTEADPRLSVPNDSIPSQQDTRSAFFTPDFPQDEIIIVSDESEEKEDVVKDKDTHASFHDVPEDTSIHHPHL
nr:hypothetical protein [Tanacetum cinerariifolium]